MTLEEMQEIAREIVAVLQKAGFSEVQYVEDHRPGEPLPIMFHKDGNDFSLDLNLV